MNIQNRLSKANSPYLRQHANNPVDWYEWGNEALERAATENKPLLISIGYAACHWCHVMARESFSDEVIADYMNENFICIKIDREERPDLDQIYMEAAHLVSGRGGWPLNSFALPDGKPFYAATYFPPNQWLQVLQQLSHAFQNDTHRVLNAANSLTEGINHNPFKISAVTEIFTDQMIENYFQHHLSMIDFESGGYAGSPKFMLPVGIEFFLQYYFHTQNTNVLKVVTATLDAMAKGGIYDQIGGGFARYSTDSEWLVPHFEKMLYDNSQLISLYSKAYQVTKNNRYKDIIVETIEFAERELMDSSGGFYSSIDADSEHEEGKFYVWSQKEIESIFDSKTAQVIHKFFQVSEKGNWEYGKNILHYKSKPENFAKSNNLSVEEFNELLRNAKEKMLLYRTKRIRPTTDDKIICAWNALMISAYINAFRATGIEKYLQSAQKTAAFIETNLLTDTGSLFRIYKDGIVSTPAFLDDYAASASAFLDLYEITFDIHWLTLSRNLTDFAIKHFCNETNDMFYYTSDEAEGLIARKYEYSDNVIPASNSILAKVLFKLSFIYDSIDYSEITRNMLTKIQHEIIRSGPYYANWATLACNYVYPFFEVSVTGNNSVLNSIEILRNYLPNIVLAGGNAENLPVLEGKLVENKNLIYVCENKTCMPPLTSIDEVLLHLKK